MTHPQTRMPQGNCGGGPVDAIISQMESLAIAEERYRDNMPENLHGSLRYEDADRSVDAANEAIERLREIY